MATRSQRRAMTAGKVWEMKQFAAQYGLVWKELGPSVKALLIQRKEKEHVHPLHHDLGSAAEPAETR